MSDLNYFTLLYVWIFVLTILIYYLARRFLYLKTKVRTVYHYPVAKAMSIMLIAFSLRHGMTEIVMPLASQFFGLDYGPVIYQNSGETIVFYLAVTLIAITYSRENGQRKNEN